VAGSLQGKLPAARQPMRPDNTAALIAAARQRHELTRSKAIRALRELDAVGAPVTFDGVSASLLARLQTAIERNRMLTEENRRLRRQLAQALGQQRSSPRASPHTPPGTSPSGNDPSPPEQPQQDRPVSDTVADANQQVNTITHKRAQDNPHVERPPRHRVPVPSTKA
jgi:hypothetical protein